MSEEECDLQDARGGMRPVRGGQSSRRLARTVQSAILQTEPNFEALQGKRITDDELLSGLMAREPDALRQLMEVYFPVLSRYGEKIVGDAALAEDVVQETFIKLWRHSGVFSSMDALKGFLFTLTRNGCLNLLRGRDREDSRHRLAAAGSSMNEEPILTDIIYAESIALIFREVKALPPHLQEVFLLCFEEGMSIAEAAAHLGIPVSVASKRKYKALVILRRKLGGARLLFPLWLSI